MSLNEAYAPLVTRKTDMKNHYQPPVEHITVKVP